MITSPRLGSHGCSQETLDVALVKPSASSEPDAAVGSLNCPEGIFEQMDTTESQSFPLVPPKETYDVGCQVSTRGLQLMKKTTGVQTYQTSFEVTMCDQSTQTGETFDEVSNSPIEIHTDSPSEHEETDTLSPRKDPSFVPSKCVEVLSDDSLSDTDDAKEAKPQDDVKFIVFKQNLYELFKWCPECGAAVQKKHASTQGTQLFVTLKCVNGHAHLWQ